MIYLKCKNLDFFLFVLKILFTFSVNVEVKRIGGGYGGKIYLPNGIAAAASVAAKKLNQPIRLWLPLEDNMRMLGKRNPYVFDYKVN